MTEQNPPGISGGKSPVGPWSYDPRHGDGVSRSDPKTWSSAAAIQRFVDDRKTDADMGRLKEESVFAQEHARRIGHMRQKIFDACDIVEGRTPGNPGDFTSAREELDRLMEATQELCSRWARVFEDIYQKKSETDDHLVALCKRFWQRCPEYGYPCAPTLHDSVYAVDPTASSVWSASVEEIELARQKRAGVPKGALDKSDLSIRNFTSDTPEFSDVDFADILDSIEKLDPYDSAPRTKRKIVMDTDAPIRLVADTATKREQQYTKAVRRMFTEVPDAHPSAGTTLL